ncbi:beta-ketoacyl synthase N-terminal-like domain-containing protein [Vreelandella sp. V005]|uniref:beta-ketoacyl synthase N-terminal-like domain-containing protein n=1 Tax=Vreelandella sp. V005 TaxID=3459608 RepID=UPI004043E76D
MGLVSPLAIGVEARWSRLLNGQSGIRRLPETMMDGLAVKIAGVIPDHPEDPEAGFNADSFAPVKDQRKIDRFMLLALAAEEEAVT